MAARTLSLTILALFHLFGSIGCPFPPCSPFDYINIVVERENVAWLMKDLPGHPVRECPVDDPRHADPEDRWISAIISRDPRKLDEEIENSVDFWLTKGIPRIKIRSWDFVTGRSSFVDVEPFANGGVSKRSVVLSKINNFVSQKLRLLNSTRALVSPFEDLRDEIKGFLDLRLSFSQSENGKTEEAEVALEDGKIEEVEVVISEDGSFPAILMREEEEETSEKLEPIPRFLPTLPRPPTNKMADTVVGSQQVVTFPSSERTMLIQNANVDLEDKRAGVIHVVSLPENIEEEV